MINMLTTGWKIIISILLFNMNLTYAQPLIKMGAGFGSTLYDAPTAAVLDKSGATYITGYFSDSVNFDPGQGVAPLVDTGWSGGYIQKLDSLGRLIWIKHLPGTKDVFPSDIEIDSAGNLYLTGIFSGTADLDPGPGISIFSSANFDLFIAKLNMNGELIWVKNNPSGSNYMTVPTIAVDKKGDIYITSNYNLSNNFSFGTSSSSITPAGGDDIFILKLNAMGNFVWVKSFGGTGDEESNSIICAPNGNIITVGGFQDNVDFDPNSGYKFLRAKGSFDAFIQILSSQGSLVYAGSFGNTDSDIANSVTTDSIGNIYITGGFRGYSTDLNPDFYASFNKTSNGRTDIFVMKLDPSANLIWVKTMGGTEAESGISIATDNKGNVYVTGNYQSTVDFNPGTDVYNLTSTHLTDVFLVKLSSNGDFDWAISAGGFDEDFAKNVVVDRNGVLTVSGEFYGNIDLDAKSSNKSFSSIGRSDIFVFKVHQCKADSVLISENACDFFNINEQTYTESGKYTQILTNWEGCDSILNIDLTISKMNLTVSHTGNTMSANQDSAYYQWYNCSNSSLLAGETGQTLSEVASGSYFVVIDNGVCGKDTSDCYEFITTSLIKKSESYFNLFPNPAFNNVKITSTQPLTNAKLRILNPLGQVIEEFLNISGTEFIVKLDELMNGMYYLEIFETDKVISIMKLVKK
jgi:hypothetical protein